MQIALSLGTRLSFTHLSSHPQFDSPKIRKTTNAHQELNCSIVRQLVRFIRHYFCVFFAELREPFFDSHLTFSEYHKDGGASSSFKARQLRLEFSNLVHSKGVPKNVTKLSLAFRNLNSGDHLGYFAAKIIICFESTDGCMLKKIFATSIRNRFAVPRRFFQRPQNTTWRIFRNCLKKKEHEAFFCGVTGFGDPSVPSLNKSHNSHKHRKGETRNYKHFPDNNTNKDVCHCRPRKNLETRTQAKDWRLPTNNHELQSETISIIHGIHVQF